MYTVPPYRHWIALFFICLVSCVKMSSNCLTSFNLYGKAIFFKHGCLIINNVYLNYKKPQNKTQKTLKPELISMCFDVFNFKQGPLSISCWSSAEQPLHVRIDLQLIDFANNIPILFIIIIPGNCTIVANPEPLFCCYTFVPSTQNGFLFFIFFLTLILCPSCHLLFKRVYSPSGVSVFKISRRCFNWGVLELSVITSCQA